MKEGKDKNRQRVRKKHEIKDKEGGKEGEEKKKKKKDEGKNNRE